jgi:hypothetical protein
MIDRRPSLPPSEVCPTQCLQQLGARNRLITQLAFDAFRCLIEESRPADAIGEALKWICDVEDVHRDVRDPLSALSLLFGVIALCRDPLSLNCHSHCECCDEDRKGQRGQRCDKRNAIPTCQFAQCVGKAGWAGEDRLIPKVAVDVRNQLVCGLIPASRFLLEALHYNPVQIVSNLLHELRSSCATATRDSGEQVVTE